ncbi:Deoxyribose-phosphate aldolase [Fulvivirga imtechensis AK7]|uniref:Deoxyribose-phosphate aldolase n=1 Tax=Fulvivirga imtechensis AK7 TaxID=1237149 RepID=L8JQW9_9BACT|nr:deoxyribose-phosphate aldolase [Fulvivirga imtechensis]ELR71235.1 Deoxyribose-phosphate aldolase [Fulvivirga imtechensis AK7]
MKNINRFIEQTNLKPAITANDVDLLVRQAADNSFLGICVPPFWVKRASREIGKRDIQLVTVIGFPLGYNMTETKIHEIELAIRDGADELDIVMNVSSFKTGLPWTKIELAKCSKLIHDEYKLLKVIIETAHLSKEEIKKACLMCADAGVDYVKTSTGFAGKGAEVEDIRLMREVLPSNVGIKASGGIKTYQQAVELINAGADRIGTSSGIEIMSEIAKG